MQQSSAATKAIRTYLLLAAMLFTSLSSMAHRVELFSNSGCASGNTLTVTAVVLYAPNNTYYNWQYKDNSGIWKYFTASSTINGTAFTVSGYENGPSANNAATLSIANATTALENVQVRVLMAENVRPRNASASTQIWGGDDEALHEVKMFRLHVYSSPTDCGGTTPGCLGNLLLSGSNYYGGFENMAYSSSSSTFTNNNFGSNASTDYTQGGNNTTAPATSGVGSYQILNNPYGMNTGNGKFAPHTGNFQMVVHAQSNTIRKAWYKTVTVQPGAVYNFSAWIARTQGSNAFSIKLTVNGNTVNTTSVSTSIGSWNQMAGTYTVPANVTSLVISIADQSATAADRFFALDDICFTQVSAMMTLGNRVWYDTDNDGINDGSENGIRGITVKLYKDVDANNAPDGAAVATTTTDANGYYSFGNLNPGRYIVGATIPAGYMKSGVGSSTPDNNTDLDNNGITLAGTEVRGNAITLSAGVEPGGNTNNTYDFGMLPDCTCTSSAGNLLVNASFESGTTGWNWNSANGSLTTGTGYVACGLKNGFNGQSSGTSKVYQDVNAVPGAVFTFKGFAGIHTAGLSCSPKLSMVFLNAAGGQIGASIDVPVTRDVDVNNGQLEQYTLTGTAPALTTKVRIQSTTTCNTMKLDAFCLTVVNPSFTLGNTVWYDVNNNGTQEATETGISGVTVKLYDAAGTYLNKTAVTDASGNYQFTNLTAGNYIVGITTPAGYTKSDVGATNVATDNQNDGTTIVTTEIRTASFTLSASTNNIDFGLKGTGKIGDFVWTDTNANGRQDAGEPGIVGATVTLTGTGGFATRTTTTGANGAYLFSDLVAGTYTVTFTTPAGLTPTVSNAAGVDDALDSDPVSGAVSVTLTAGQTNLTVDAGFYHVVNLGNKVFYDRNNNGIQDATDPGVGEVIVSLYKDANTDNTPDGAAIATTATSPAGIYNFTNLAPGNYIVGINMPNGYAQGAVTATSANANNDDNTDNNGVVVSGSQLRSNTISLLAGTEPDVAADGDDTNGNLTIDFGLKATGAIGDFVWNDLNRNGIQDAGEPGIAGVTVTLTLPDATTRTTVTNNLGAYSFDNLRGGNYSVAFTTPAAYFRTVSNSAATGATDLNDSDPINGVAAVTLSTGQVNNTVDAGFFRKINISGNIWHDANGNFDDQVNQTSPIPIPVGMILYLVNDNTGIIEQALSPEFDGTYTFEDVKMNTSYRLVLSTTVADPGEQAPMASLPTGWTNTGENLGAGPNSGSDGISDGTLYIDTQSSDIFNANFGIKLGNGEIIIG